MERMSQSHCAMPDNAMLWFVLNNRDQAFDQMWIDKAVEPIRRFPHRAASFLKKDTRLIITQTIYIPSRLDPDRSRLPWHHPSRWHPLPSVDWPWTNGAPAHTAGVPAQAHQGPVAAAVAQGVAAPEQRPAVFQSHERQPQKMKSPEILWDPPMTAVPAPPPEPDLLIWVVANPPMPGHSVSSPARPPQRFGLP